MKVCELCGTEISTRDGENRCQACESVQDEVTTKRLQKLKKARIARRERDAVMRSIGLVKVRGAMGGTYWE